jgi:two-component system phosphate regulon response regulator PhoB
MTDHTILIVDDEDAIRDMLAMALEIAGFRCIQADNIFDAHTLIVDEKPSLLVLDWMLPEGSGVELLRRLRRDSITEQLPVIMLTAKTAEANIIQGLEVGADDYVTKPVAPKELIARIKALLRRSGGDSQKDQLLFGDLVLDKRSHRVFVAGSSIDVGPTEFKLLLFFMTNPNRAYTRGQILDHVWGSNVYVEERTVDVHIRRLRKALQCPRCDLSTLIETVRGMGYRFTPPTENKS